MKFAAIFTVLVAAVSASPVPDALVPRSCSLASTKIAGQSLKGPFKLQAIGDFKKTGNYATAGTSGKVVFNKGAPRKGEANDFYLNASGNLVTVENGRIYSTFESDPAYNVQVGGGSPKVHCKLNSGSCNMACSVGSMAYNCLSSPGYVPDWRINTGRAGSGTGCVPFQAVAVVL